MSVAKKSKASTLLEIAQSEASYFISTEGEIFAKTIRPIERAIPLFSTDFDDWLIGSFHAATAQVAPASALSNLKQTLRALARGNGSEMEVFRRVGVHDNKYYLDLCDHRGRVVEIAAGGWTIISQPPVMFVRHKSMKALPVPERGGWFKDVTQILNLPNGAVPLLRAWLIECMRPDTPYLGLALCGQQGSAKSTLQSMLRELIDPNVQNLRLLPRSIAGLHASAQASHVLSFENVSDLSCEVQDHLCATLTGAAAAERALFTNAEESLVSLKRPVVLNGISDFVTRPDLLDRCIILHVPVLSEGRRRTEQDVWASFNAARPKLLGALLTSFANALARLQDVQKQKHELSRMADFTLLGEALSQGLGRQPGQFIVAYKRNRRAGVNTVVNASPVGSAIRLYIRSQIQLDGPIGRINELLRRHVSGRQGSLTGSMMGWPRTDRAFGEELRRVAPGLALIGIKVQMGKRMADGYHVKIFK